MKDKHYISCPPERIAALIRLANSISPRTDLPPVDGRPKRILALVRTQPFRRFRKLRPICNLEGEISGAQGVFAIAAYVELSATRTLLRAAATYSSDTNLLELTNRVHRVISLLPGAFIHTEVDRDRLQFSLGETLDALAGVEITRIGQCPVCKQVFWKKRIDQKACNRRCANTFRVRNSRSQERKLQRYRNAEWREKRRGQSRRH